MSVWLGNLETFVDPGKPACPNDHLQVTRYMCSFEISMHGMLYLQVVHQPWVNLNRFPPKAPPGNPPPPEKKS